MSQKNKNQEISIEMSKKRKLPVTLGLSDLADIKELIKNMWSQGLIKEIKEILKELMSCDVEVKDVQTANLVGLIDELKKDPVLEVHADILEQKWKAMAHLRSKGSLNSEQSVSGPCGSKKSLPTSMGPSCPKTVDQPISFHSPHTDPRRNVVINRFASALHKALGPKSSLEEINRLSVSLEEIIHNNFPQCSQQARMKIGHVHQALQSHPRLCHLLVCGELTPDKLIKMKPEELLEHAGDIEMNGKISCEKCHSVRVSSFDVTILTDSKTEELTTFYSCKNCGTNWKEIWASLEKRTGKVKL